jgi:hypothetical protein
MRTFIFGAGASVHAGYPLATELWPVMERWARATFPEGHHFRDAVDTMNAEFDVSKSFELVLMELDNRIEPFLKTRPATDQGLREKVMLVYLRSAIKSMIPFYFNSLRSQPADLYRIFASDLLARGDVVITFNYDLAVDRELEQSGKWNIGSGYGFSIEGITVEDSPCKLLKLHGSTNWTGEPFQGSLGFSQGSWENLSLGQRPIIHSSEFGYLGYSNSRDPQCHDGPVRIESLIMPTANKQFFNETSLGREWEGFWDSLWYPAGKALEASKEVFLVGYSIPGYDTRARDLLATKIANDAQIEVCCHNGTTGVIKSLNQLIRSRNVHVCPTRATTFEDWIGNVAREGGA